MHEFLKLEYEQCLALVKYYDEKHHALVKYSAGLSSAVPSVIFAFYSIGDNTHPFFWQFVAFISSITAIGLLAILTTLVQNRLYFIYPARQANAIRKAMIFSSEFDNNQMYLDASFSAFKWTSSHSLLIAFVSIQLGLFWGLSQFSLMTHPNEVVDIVFSSTFSGVCAAVLAFSASAQYLIKKGAYSPDQSIHNTGNEGNS